MSRRFRICVAKGGRGCLYTNRFFFNCLYVTLVTISVYFINTAWALSKSHSVSLQALHSESALQAFKVEIQFQKTFEANNFGPKHKLIQFFLKTLDPSDWLPTDFIHTIMERVLDVKCRIYMECKGGLRYHQLTLRLNNNMLKLWRLQTLIGNCRYSALAPGAASLLRHPDHHHRQHHRHHHRHRYRHHHSHHYNHL